MRTRYVIGADDAIEASDRGLAYGDGLFETVAIRDAVLLRLPWHLDRLLHGCARLAIAAPDTDELTTRLGAAAGGIVNGTLKLILTRGSGRRGYSPPADPVTTVVIQAWADTSPIPESLRVVTLELRLAESTTLSQIKHLCRLEQVLGRLELSRRDADEGLMLSTGGQVIGGTSRNLFAVIDGRLVTPDLARAGIAGVMRRAVLERAPSLAIETEVRPVTEADLAGAEELFMTNALVGIQSVSSLDDIRTPSRAVAAMLRSSFASDPGPVYRPGAAS